MRKVFKPLNESVNEKRFIADDEPIEMGWFEDPAEALASYEKPKRRGRPPKAEVVAEMEETAEEPAEEEAVE